MLLTSIYFQSVTGLDLLERRADMTTFTLPAETAVVYIIAVMTTAATCRQTYFSAYRPLVTGRTRQTSMTAIELERGARVMVELPCLPVSGVMA